jgi:hypothetical protein
MNVVDLVKLRYWKIWKVENLGIFEEVLFGAQHYSRFHI